MEVKNLLSPQIHVKYHLRSRDGVSYDEALPGPTPSYPSVPLLVQESYDVRTTDMSVVSFGVASVTLTQVSSFR